MTPLLAPAAVQTTALTKRFGDRTVVDRLDLDIPASSVCGFVGPNGAGKTTTIRMLLGLVRPTSGTGAVLGQPIERPSTYLDRVGALIEAPAFHPQLSGHDNLLVLARLGGRPESVIAPALDVVGLSARGGERFRRYSLGMKQRLGIAAALLTDPELIVLDEPANGLDPAGILEMRGLIRSLADRGMTVFVSSHLLAEVEQLCDHLVMIREGRLLFQGAVQELYVSQRSELALRTEQPTDIDRLIDLVVGAGHPAHLDRDSDEVVVAADPSAGASLNWLAMSNGILLSQVVVRAHRLEDAFFSLTGTHSGDGGPTTEATNSTASTDSTGHLGSIR